MKRETLAMFFGFFLVGLMLIIFGGSDSKGILPIIGFIFMIIGGLILFLGIAYEK